MTTVDVLVRRLDDDGGFDVSNGLGGPATLLLTELGDLVRHGEIDGEYQIGELQGAVCPGHLLRDLLAGAGEGRYKLGGQRASAAEVLKTIDADGTYRVSGVEF